MDALVFSEFAEKLTEAWKKALEEEGKDETLSLDSLLKPKPSPPEKRPDDEEEFLKLHDGNYLKAKEAGEEPPNVKETGV
jgi:hypothetical protein